MPAPPRLSPPTPLTSSPTSALHFASVTGLPAPPEIWKTHLLFSSLHLGLSPRPNACPRHCASASPSQRTVCPQVKRHTAAPLTLCTLVCATVVVAAGLAHCCSPSAQHWAKQTRHSVKGLLPGHLVQAPLQSSFPVTGSSPCPLQLTRRGDNPLCSHTNAQWPWDREVIFLRDIWTKQPKSSLPNAGGTVRDGA